MAVSKQPQMRARKKRATSSKRAAQKPVTDDRDDGTPTILIDDRGGSQDLIKFHPLSRPGVGELCRLSVNNETSADVEFAGNGPVSEVLIGVEVKSITDLISSIDTGRLQGTQVPAMLAKYDYCYLLHYGDYRPNSDGYLQLLRGKEWKDYAIGSRPVRYGWLESWLCTLRASGFTVKEVRADRVLNRKTKKWEYDLHEAAMWLACLARWWHKKWKSHQGMHAFDSSRGVSLMPDMDPVTELIARTAKEWPGLGFQRALAAANYFTSVEEMATASIEDWMAIPGVGETIANVVKEAIKRR